MTAQEKDLETFLYEYLDRRGGVVIERLINILKKSYSEDAPELQSEEAFKEFINAKPELFRIAVSVNNVERARLTNPQRPSPGLMPSVVAALEELSATTEEDATPIKDILDKVVASRKENLADGAELPYDLASEADFVRSLNRFKRIRIQDGKAWLGPSLPRRRRPNGVGPTSSGDAEGGEGAAEDDAPPRRPGPPRGRPSRKLGEPKTPQELGDLSGANDATLIASLIYHKLCERGAVNIETGVTVKLLLRLVSIDFKSARPEAEPTSMNSLRIFKMLLTQIPGTRRQRPRVQPRSPRRAARTRSYTPELIVWLDADDELVEAIKAGLPDDTANMVVPPDVIDNIEAVEAGTPMKIQVLEQESWNTNVIGPTANEEVLKKFLSDQEGQSVWGFETEHRVGLRGKPPGKIAVIVLSDMHDTIVWDVHVGGIPQCLHDFFSSEDIYKAGVRVGQKVAKLRKQFGVTPAKFVELAEVAHGLGHISDEEKERVSMRIITSNVLSTPIMRPPGIRDSNWELRPLTKRQYMYAIEDGFVTALLFMQLVSELHNMGHGAMLNKACVE